MLIRNIYASEYSSDLSTAITLQDTEKVVPENGGVFDSAWSNVVPMVLIFLVFYFLLIRPQEKRRRQQEQFVNSVKKGEDVMTTSGIFGVVTKISDADNTVHVEIAKDIQIRILKSTISDITSRKKEVAKQESAVKKDYLTKNKSV